MLNPAGRGEPGYGEAKATAHSECDIFIDLRGMGPAFPSHEKRNGYFWADPARTGELERIALNARELVGEFEKTVYFRLEESLCAHSRANQPGCTRCLDVCCTRPFSLPVTISRSTRISVPDAAPARRFARPLRSP